MKYKLMLLGKVIFPPVTCFFLIWSFKVYVDFQWIITFSLIIVLFNKKKIKHNLISSLIYSILLSFLVLTLSMGIGSLIMSTKELLLIDVLPKELLKKLDLIPKAIVSPLLMFYAYRLLFNINTTNYFRGILMLSVFLLFILGLYNVFSANKTLFIAWQFTMSLALQLILYEKETFKLFSKKNSTSIKVK